MRTLLPYASIAAAVLLLVASGNVVGSGALTFVLLGIAMALIAVAAAAWASQGDGPFRAIVKCGVTGAAFSGVLFLLLLAGPWSGGEHGEARVTVLSRPVPVLAGVVAGTLVTAALCALVAALGYGLSRVIRRERKADPLI